MLLSLAPIRPARAKVNVQEGGAAGDWVFTTIGAKPIVDFWLPSGCLLVTS